MKNTQTESAKIWWRDGFYDHPIEGGAEIPEQRWRELLDGQSTGYRIVTGVDGYPTLIEDGPQTLDEHREAKLEQIATHDRSDRVNRFYVGDVPAWFDKATRSGLRNTLEAEESVGRTTTVLWIGSAQARPVEMPITTARRMLAKLEVYSKAVFDATQRHRAAVYAMTSIEEVKAYDHAAGYPDNLRFETPA